MLRDASEGQAVFQAVNLVCSGCLSRSCLASARFDRRGDYDLFRRISHDVADDALQ